MNAWDELRAMEHKLNELRKENNRLFAAHIELRINQSLIEDKLREIRQRNEQLLGRPVIAREKQV